MANPKTMTLKKSKRLSDKNPSSKLSTKTYLKRYWQLYAMLLLPMIYLFVFKYAPMVYIQIAFKKFMLNMSVWDMPLAKNNGMEFFIKAFKSKDCLLALRNTIRLNLLDLIVGFPAPIIFALLLNELNLPKFKKVVQTITYMPHFLSWVIIASLTLQLFAPTDGLVNMAISKMGGEPIPFPAGTRSYISRLSRVSIRSSTRQQRSTARDASAECGA